MRTLTVPLACVALVCGAPTFAAAQDVSIVEVWRSSGEPVSWLAGAHTDGRTIWLLDGLSQEVHAFVIGTEEVDRLVLPTASRMFLGGGSDLLAVYDGAAGRIELFDKAGSRQGALPVPAQLLFPKSLRVLEDGSVLIGSGMSGSNAGLHRLRADGSVAWQTLPVPAARQPIIGRMVAGAVVLTDDGLFAAVSSAHTLLTVDLATGTMDTLMVDPVFFPPTSDDFVGTDASGQSMNRWFYPRSAGLQRLPTGRLIHFVRFAEDDSTRWEIVVEDGRIASGSITGAYELWGVHPATGALIATRLIDRTRSVPVLLEVRERR